MDSELLKRVPSNQILVLDTETTGIDDEAEILQFSAIWGTGRIAMNIYIKPTYVRRWDEAMEVNHITPAMVADSPKMRDLKPKIEALLDRAKVIVGYNLPFDLRMLEQNGVKFPWNAEYIDIMLPFAEIYGESSRYYGGFKWQKLITCARYYGYTEEGWHDSLADAKATLYCFRKMLECGDL